MSDTPFQGMDEHSSHFYKCVFGRAMMNWHAVKMGYFDTLLCETDDPRVALRWEEMVPKIALIMRQRAADDREDNER